MSADVKNDLDNLLPLMKKKGVTVSKEIFHQEVNTVFHDVESKYYDALHHGMDTSLQEQFDLIGADISKLASSEKKLTLLDIGCGTGMSTDKLLKSSLRSHISKVYLLDTSKGMLDQCKQKAEKWNIPYELVHGDIYSLNNIQFDVILTCSVLHHIPNLSDFLGKVASLQKEKGFFVHLQDPNGDFIFTDAYLNRKNELKAFSRREKLQKGLLKAIAAKIKRKFNIHNSSEQDYIHEVNEQLMKKEIIKAPLSDIEIWSITDLHVEDLPNHHGKGISLKFLKNTLVDYQLVKQRSYAFFGNLKMDLPISFQKKEELFIKNGDLSGRELAGIWQHS